MAIAATDNPVLQEQQGDSLGSPPFDTTTVSVVAVVQSRLAELSDALDKVVGHLERPVACSASRVEPLCRDLISRRVWEPQNGFGETVAHLVVRHHLPVSHIDDIASAFPVTWSNTTKHPFHIKDQTDQEATPLIRAVATRKYEHAAALLRGRASTVQQDVWGRTALHYATMRGDVSALSRLGSLMDASSIKDRRGRLPLDYVDRPDWCRDGLASYGVDFQEYDPTAVRACFSRAPASGGSRTVCASKPMILFIPANHGPREAKKDKASSA